MKNVKTSDFENSLEHIVGERLGAPDGQRDVLGVSIPQRTIPVAPGRNLAVLVEAAVRDYILRSGGYNATRDLVEKTSTSTNSIMNRLTIVTGLSGSGKSVALHTLEDEGFYCIDNLPSSMVNDLLDNVQAGKNKMFEQLAIGIDMRGEHYSPDQFLTVLRSLQARTDLQTDVLFLDTSRQTLSTRFSETRRKHPLSSGVVPAHERYR